MFKHARNIAGAVAASLVLFSASADAQGKSKDKGERKENAKGQITVQRTADGDWDRNRDGVRNDRDHKNKGDKNRNSAGVRDDRVHRDNGDWDRNRDGVRDGTVRKVPPGLAKKPGQMPPGQYKKRYGTAQGASVLGEILGQRGYTAIRTEPFGTSQYVYYRTSDGVTQRAIVGPGTDRLTFTNVPADLVRLVLARLY